MTTLANLRSGAYILAIFLCTPWAVWAEGSKQLSPTANDEVLLHTANPTFGNFATFNGPVITRLYVRINNFNTETLYIGLSPEVDDNGIVMPAPASYQFRIVAPDGTVVHGPFTVGTTNANCNTWAEAVAGPDALFMGGYNTALPYATFSPSLAGQNGDYRIEFMDTPASVVNIKWFDFTVASGGQEIPGRLWSYNWVLRTPQIGVVPPECGWDRPFNGAFYTYTEEGFVSKVDFEGSGFQGLTFIVAFGDNGPGNSGDVIEDRKSVNTGTAGQIGDAADHQVFVNPPDENVFPTPPDLCGIFDFLGTTCDTGGYCLLVGITQPGLIEVIFDFFGANNQFDPGTTDVVLAIQSEEADTLCLYWNGLKGDGTPLTFNEPVPVIMRYSQGIQHYSAYDVELLYNGFCTETVRPACAGMSNLLYWDDSNIIDNPVTTFVDESDPGTGQPLVQVNGCICQVNSCRTWNNYQLGANPNTCEGEAAGYGNERILNTWWYAVSSQIGPLNLPIVRAQITGNNEVCPGGSTVFTVNTNPDSLAYIYSWTGPGGFMAGTASTGIVSVPGTYYVTISDPVTGCEATDSIVFEVTPAIITTIDFECIGANQPNANIDLTIIGGVPPYFIEWSNNETTEDLLNVPPGLYIVVITDANNCIATDSVLVEDCCVLEVTCPPSDGGTFACLADVPAPDNNLVIILDFCTSTTIIPSDIGNGATGCGQDSLFITRTYTITDGQQNQEVCIQVFTVIDDIGPMLSCPVNLTIECDESILPANTGMATATDNCGGTPSVTFSDMTVGGGCPDEFTINRTWLATDNCGNTSTCVQVITIEDSTAPVLSCPAPATIECSDSILPANTGTATATDNCDSTPGVTFSDMTVGGACPHDYTINRTWLATDDCGNIATCLQVITVEDTTPPSITCPQDITIECTANPLPPNTGSATATDNCDSAPVITFTDMPGGGGGCAQGAAINRTWVATDACGNSSSCVQLIFIDDTTPPEITCPANTTIECTESILPGNTGMATATDNCAGAPVVTFTDMTVGGGCPQEYQITRTWLATDLCGNTAFCTQVITVEDNTPPAVICPATATIECTESILPANTGMATASDNCDNTPSVTFTDMTVGGECPQEFTINRTWSATDDCGNTGTCVQVINVVDTTPPVVSCPVNTTVECTESILPANTGMATASDNCDGAPGLTFSDATVSGSCPQEFTINRTWIATDACGNTGTCVQEIFVEDSTPPSISCPQDIVIECSESILPANTGTATATDNCGGTPVVGFSDVTVGSGCPQEFTINRTWTATDACGNSTACVQVIAVIDDTPPQITCPADITIVCTAATLPGNTGQATATDNCDGAPGITFSDSPGQGGCPQEQVISRTWIATDACGNSSTCQQTITVVDTIPPVITCPVNTTIECDESILPANTGTATASDNCDGAPEVSFSDMTAEGSCPQEYTIIRTWIATDACDNSSTCTQLILVEDTQAPEIIPGTCPADMTISCDVDEIELEVPEYTDNCGEVTLDIDVQMTGFVPPSVEGQIIRTFILTDECGNVNSDCVQVITIVDDSAPEIVCPGDLMIECGSSTDTSATGTPTYSDNCGLDDDLVVTFTDVEIGFEDACASGMILRTFTVTDPAGNITECTQTITVVDNLAPTFTLPPPVTVQCGIDLDDLTLTGNISNVLDCSEIESIGYEDDFIETGCAGTGVIERTWTVTDACGLFSTGIQLITVIDQGSPSVIPPPNVTISCEDDPLDLSITGSSVVVTDACSSVFETGFTDNNSGLTGCNGTGQIIRTWTAEDECGNTASAQQVITVADVTPPVALCQNITINFDADSIMSITPDMIDNGSFDNCGDVTLSLSQSTFDCIIFRDTPTLPFNMTVLDECGNNSVCTFTITGEGGGGILMTCPSDVTINLGAGQCETYYHYYINAERRCGIEDPVLEQIDFTGYTSGDAFPVGTFLQEYRAYNSQGDTLYCSFYITIVGYVQTIDVMACNDQVNFTLDKDCELMITPDMILEGGHYSCYNDFLIEISNGVSGYYNVLLDASNTVPGSMYIVTITDNKTGNKCWGKILVEDKRPPTLNCMDVEIYCNTPLAPVFTEPGEAILAYAPQFSDNCSDNITYTYQDELFQSACGLDSVLRTWQFFDGYGNSSQCVQRLIVTPATLDDVVFPEPYIGSCFGNASPDVTGWPTVGGVSIGSSNPRCNLWAWYDDITLNDCGAGTKILRRWTAYDGCTQEHIRFTQAIKLADMEPPVLTCPPALTVGTDFWYCHANILLAKPGADDACGSDLTFVPLVPSGVGQLVLSGGSYTWREVPEGTWPVTWQVTDACGNTATCTYLVTVTDNVPPVALCDQHTIIALTNDGPKGVTLVEAEVFNDGSYDNCGGPLTLEVLRMPANNCAPGNVPDWTTNGACIDDVPDGLVNSRDLGNVHRPCVPFFCCDVGRGPIQVELRVTDAFGNENFCMVSAEVQDKIPPVVQVPPDIIVSCDFWFHVQEGVINDADNDGDLDEDPLSPIFGNLYDAYKFNDDQGVRQPIVVNDPGNITLAQPHTWGIDGWADDNCDLIMRVQVIVTEDCSGNTLPANAPAGAVKLIERRFQVQDGQGNQPTGVVRQRIWVVDFRPFFITDQTCNNPNPQDGVIWPCDLDLSSCPSGEFTPDALNSRPVIFDDNCSIAAVTYEDEVYVIDNEACIKILRKWFVIDWCQYDTQTGTGIWQYTQVIKVIDTEEPFFTSCPSAPPVYCVADDNVTLPDNNQVFLGEANPNSTSCTAHIRLEQTVVERCSETITYDVKVYPFNGDNFHLVVPRTELTLQQDTALLVFDTRTCAIPLYRLEGMPYNSPLCDDQYYHRILWTMEDGCGNIETCEYLFRLEDCKAPSPVCINGLSTVVMPANGEITLWAVDFNASSFDDCTPAAELLYSFSGTSYQPSITYTCDSLTENGGPVFEVHLWVADGGNDENCNGTIQWQERNKDYCTTYVMVLDNLNMCDGNTSGIAGTISTESLVPVEGTEVTLSYAQATETRTTATNEEGFYYFFELPQQVDYKVAPYRNTNHKEGVSTLDLLAIQRHLLSIEELGSPFKLIAADANNSQTVSAIDLLEIRKLVLGIYNEFPHNTSWRFVPVNYEFIDPYRPWPFDESVHLESLEGLALETDFRAVKVGDVNNSALANLTDKEVQIRGSRPEVILEIPDLKLSAGATVRVPVFVRGKDVGGMQFTLHTGGLSLAAIEPGALQVDEQHYAIFDNVVTFSWNDAAPMTLDAGAAAFILVLHSGVHQAQLGSHLSLSSAITTSEAYVYEAAGFAEAALLLDMISAGTGLEADEEYVLFQNKPNPWKDETRIGFSLPRAMHARLTIFDPAGKQLLVREMDAAKGYSEFRVSANELPAQTVLYYKVDAQPDNDGVPGEKSATWSATKKMVLLD